MKKLLIVTMVMFVILTSSIGALAADKLEVGFIVKTMANPYFTRMLEGAEQAAEDYDVNLNWVSAEKHTDTSGQLNIVEDMIEKDVDILVINPAGPKAIVPAIDKANQKGIPVIVVDTIAEGGKIESFIGVDNYSAAVQIAEFSAEHLNGKGKIAILEGVRGHSTAEDRMDGYHDVLDKYPDIEIVASQTANYDRSEGMRVTENILISNPDLDFIIASNDEMALGAIRAIQGARKQDQVEIVGFDAIDDALAAIQKGELLATVENVPDRQGYVSVQKAVEYMQGKEIEKEIIIDCIVVTEENVDQFTK
jgi:ribose transport system substrate-binding protein